MKVVTLSTKDSFGGAARVAFRLHEEINKLGIDNMLLVNNKRSNSSTVRLASDFHDHLNRFERKMMMLGLKYKEQRRRRNWAKYPRMQNKILSDIALSLLKNALDKIPFDLIHLHWVGESYVDFTEFGSVKDPIIWTLHDCFSFTALCSYFEDCDKYKTHCGACPQLGSTKEKDFSYKVFDMKRQRYSSLNFVIVTPSRWLAKAASESVLLRKYPVRVIPNGLDTEVFRPKDKMEAKKSLSLQQGKKTILFGGISAMGDPRKGGHLLKEALKLLAETELKDQLELLIFGAEQKNEDNLEFPAKYLGYIPDEDQLCEAYNAADVMIVPSTYENLPNTILESLSCGTPVVAFNIGGNPDMIDHTINGYLADPYDIADLAEGVRFCLNNNKANQLGVNARNKVLENFRIEDIAKRYIELYNEVLNKD